MSTQETDRIVAELSALPEYQGWRISREYPGFYCYSRPGARRVVFFMLEWGHDRMAIEVQRSDGRRVEYDSDRMLHLVVRPLPREGRTGPKIFELVRPALDSLAAEAP